MRSTSDHESRPHGPPGPSAARGKSFPREGNDFRREENSFPRKDNGFRRKENAFRRGENSFRCDENFLDREEKSFRCTENAVPRDEQVRRRPDTARARDSRMAPHPRERSTSDPTGGRSRASGDLYTPPMDGQHVGIGLAIGSGLGVVLGSMLGALSGDLGLWIALGVPLGAGLGLAGALVWHEMTRPAPPDACPNCGYDTSGLPRRRGAVTCPECGEACT